MTAYQEMQGAAHYVGLCVSRWAPGDGMTRYRFYVGCGNDYFGPGNPVYTALGSKAANTWLRGFTAGRNVTLDIAVNSTVY